jgi:hypothetical protein
LIFSFLIIFLFDVNSTGLMETWNLEIILLYDFNAFLLLFVSMFLLGLLLEKRKLLVVICFNLLSKLFIFYEWNYSGDLIVSMTSLGFILFLPLLIPFRLKNWALNKVKLGKYKIFIVLSLVVLSVVVCYYAVHIDYVYPTF